MWSEKTILKGFKMKKNSFRYLCLLCGVILALLSLFVYYRLNRFEPTESQGIVFDNWKGKYYSERFGYF